MVHLDNTFVRDCASGNGCSAGTGPRAYLVDLKHPSLVVDENTAAKNDPLSFYLQTRPHGNVRVLDLVVNTDSTES
jgi:hypothetical protein